MADQISYLPLADNFDRVKKWPIIPFAVPEKPISSEEQADVRVHIESGIAIIRELLGDVDPKCIRFCGDKRNHYVSEKCRSYNFLTCVLLPGARTVEQVRDIVAGYVIYCIENNIDDLKEEGRAFRGSVISKLPEEVRGKFRPLSSYAEWKAGSNDWFRLYYHHVYIGASTGHCARMLDSNVFHHFESALNLKQCRRYNYEPNHDCLQTILSDTQRVFCKHTGISKDPVKRRIPEHKKMTPEKVSRFFSLPGLFEYIDADAEMGDEVLASNLTIIAEYFCENDGVLYKNEVTKKDIDEWMLEKFERYHPSLNVATYIWARFLGTEFEGTALWIEQYILDLLEKDSPWVFESAGRRREECRAPNDLFDVYERAMTAVEREADGFRAHDLLYMIPAKELFEASMASKNYKGSTAIKTLHGRVSDLYLYLPDKYTAERYENDFNGFCFDLFRESIESLAEWKAVEGFELLDPMAIDGYSNVRGWAALKEILEKVTKKMEEMKPSELLKFKEAVVDRLPEPVRAKVVRIVTGIAEKWAVSVSFDGYGTGTLADMAMGAEGVARPALVLPGGISLDAFCGEKFSAERVDALAERAVLERHLKGVRGDEQIIGYLLRHRGAMVPVDLVVPRPDAPNLDIIREFGDSSDLLALLSVATLLVYLGYDYNQVMAEVRMQAEIAEKTHHPDLTSIGAEYEQLGATPEGRIISETRYVWLFNVLASGGDIGSNEMKTPPTLSAVMQKYIFALIIDPRFQFINARMLWDIAERSDRCPSGIHVNVAIPKELPFSEELVRKYMAPVQDMQWLVNGGGIGQQHTARGKIRHWKGGALLDVLDDKHTELKVEYRSLSLDKKGDYAKQIEMLQLLSSAAIQFMREKAGLNLSSSGKVLAQIYERFRVESMIVLSSPNDVNVTIAAKALMEKFADAARVELNRPKVSKREGIVIL